MTHSSAHRGRTHGISSIHSPRSQTARLHSRKSTISSSQRLLQRRQILQSGARGGACQPSAEDCCLRERLQWKPAGKACRSCWTESHQEASPPQAEAGSCDHSES
ncbi:hypothetical protein Mapa_004493 [Marchantia paleacea]|nr:hypothetical protein Mapa_004493 [Marchantia paleacea]